MFSGMFRYQTLAVHLLTLFVLLPSAAVAHPYPQLIVISILYVALKTSSEELPSSDTG